LGDKKGGGWQFYFSIDGGASWKEAELGKVVYFKPAPNPDFRWRVDFIPIPNLSDSFHSPFLYQFQLSYGIIK